jgi:hypothetical protein
MSGGCDPQYQWLQINNFNPKLILNTTIKPEGDFELTSQTFVGHVNLILGNLQATMFRISVGDSVRNPYIESIEIVP